MQSVENTIAKAQATEQFRSKVSSLGLGGDLSSLLKYTDEIPEDSTQAASVEDTTELDLTEIDDNEINSVSCYKFYFFKCCKMY